MTMELKVADPTTYQVFDGQRNMNVHGWHLASADTQQGTSVRWTEMSLYRTKSGRYVLEKVGRSDVFHSEFCSQNSKGIEYADLSAARSDDFPNSKDREFVGCTRCRPGPNPNPVFVERDIFSASIYASAGEMIESLFKPSSDQLKFLTRVGRELLATASENDDEIAKLLQTPIDVD